jgi:RNA polymerase sigma factor (sigma-70 family)
MTMIPTSDIILSPPDPRARATADLAASHRHIADDLERLLGAARPRLLRLARLNGVSASAADDVVQEALLQAWRSLGHLRQPSRFDAWLDGICRNVSRRHLRAESSAALRLEPLAAGQWEADEESWSLDLADPQASDLDEALSRQDLLALLDRGLGHLSPPACEALQLHYVAEVPREEAASRLGISPATFDVRLHRARRQLREVLSTQLRAEAAAFGLVPEGEENADWRETRLWCYVCGQRRLQGRFEPQPDGAIRFYLRCPDCYERYGVFSIDTPLEGPEMPRALVPAFKRVARAAALFYPAAADPARGPQPCFLCGTSRLSVRIVRADDVPMPTLPGRHYFFTECPRCGLSFSLTLVAFWLDPAVQRFIAGHSRWVCPPEELADYAGMPAFHFRLIDLPSAAQLHIFADAATLQVRATSEE